MGWGPIDDGFFAHPKVVDLLLNEDTDPWAALGVWVIALSWAHKYTVNKPPAEQGVIPAKQIKAWDRMTPGALDAAEALAKSELWERMTGGDYRIHDFRQWGNLELREQKQRGGRASAHVRWGTPLPLEDESASNSATNAASNSATNAATEALVTSSPSLSRPNLKDSPAGLTEFERFYWAYPRHKSRAQAERAWVKAITRADPEVITAAAAAVADLVERGIKKAAFVPYPATWLNADGWADDLDEEDSNTQHDHF